MAVHGCPTSSHSRASKSLGRKAPPAHCPSASSWERSLAPQPSVSTLDRSARHSDSWVSSRSRITCQRIDGSESRSQPVTLLKPGMWRIYQPRVLTAPRRRDHGRPRRLRRAEGCSGPASAVPPRHVKGTPGSEQIRPAGCHMSWRLGKRAFAHVAGGREVSCVRP